MSAATKKPLPPGVGSSPSSSPVRQPPRSSTPTGSAPGTVTRTRSIRSGNPVSARAAAPRRESPLSGSGGSEADQESRAEAVAALEDLKDRLARAETASEQYRKQGEVAQARLEDALREQAALEEKQHEAEEHIEALRNEKREAARQMREMEAIYEAERSAMTREKEDMGNREEEMQTVIQRLKDSLAQRNTDDEIRPSRQANSSPSVDGGNFAPPSSLHRSDSRNNSKLVLQKDKLIESLRLELAEAQIKLVESENQGGGRLHEVERQLMEARMANARLMEDNESYQLLLQEKTLHGDFGKGDFSYMGGSRGSPGGGAASSNQDALNALEGRSTGTSLADELSGANDDSAGEGADADTVRRLESELRAQKDQNKALTLYINKIIERLLQHQDFEHILDQSSDARPTANTNKDLPPPPPEKPAGPSLLQRAKSIAVSATKPRPMSVMALAGGGGGPSPHQHPSAHHDPITAPSIPIGNFGNLTRSNSARRSRPMSEQYTGSGGAGAAGIVSQMYRGGSDSSPVSPTMGNPRHSQTFFVPSGLSQSSTPGGGGVERQRPSTGTQAPTTGNFPGMRSETSSTSGDSADVSTPPSQSPPRPGHHEKATTFAGGKPRPLRLVQENPDAVKADSQNKRASWIGWAWGKKDEPGSGGSESIPE